ncbi:MAG: extracellular solute-binding protein [Sphaerochaetaceae bacterium]|nr:extracellular solute-binding protein [Sphaerochaetaceae bacterium]
MKKLFIILFINIFLLSLFAKGVKEDEKVVIEYWTHEDANRQVLEDRYAREFMEMNPGVTIIIKRFSSFKMLSLVMNAFLAGEGPTMFNLTSVEAYQFIEGNMVAPVDYQSVGYSSLEELEKAYMDGSLDPCKYDGKLYGLPLEMTNWSIYVNKRILREAGIDPDTEYPRTWEDMVELSKKLVERDSNGILLKRGFDFRYPYYLEAMVPMVEQLGGHLVSEDGTEAIIGKDAWVKWLTFMRDWGPLGLNLGSPTYRNARYLFNLNDGQVAMANTGLYQEARIKSENPLFYESDDWMVIPFPLFKDSVKDVSACYYGQYLMVNSSASKRTQELSWAFIGYLLDHSVEYLEKVNIMQPTHELFRSETYRSMPYSDVFTDDISRGHALYISSCSNELQKLLGEAVESVMLQGIAPETAYYFLKSSAQELLDES